MAATPGWKVYDGDGNYVAACKHPGDCAAVIAGCYGPGATIRLGHKVSDIAWTEGAQDQDAADSFDHVAEICFAFEAARREKWYQKYPHMRPEKT